MNDKPTTALEQKKDRRGLLTLIGAGGIAAVAALFSRSNGAQAGHGPADATNALHLGQGNEAPPSNTDVVGGGIAEGDPVISVQNLNGVLGSVAIAGASHDMGDGVRGFAPSGIGILGFSENGDGANGHTVNGTGVLGTSQTGAGVLGHAPGDAPAVQAVSGVPDTPILDNGLALDVVGKARFSSAAMAELPPGAKKHTVSDPHVQGGSLVLTTLHSDPGKGTAIAWVEVAAGGGSFTVRMTRKTTSPTKLCYFVVN